ncbi:MAG: hypothetical protein IBJ09_15395, partial [Bacteroidia bacterium]|nr:hypothetical protein [Bacteroidia bacterium]
DVTDTLDFVNFENPVIVMSGGNVQTVDGWGRYSAATLSVVTSGGSQMLEVTSSNPTHGTHKDFAVTPGKTYTLSMNVDVGTAGAVNIIVWQFVTTSSLSLMTPVPYLAMSSNGTYTVTITPTMPNLRIQMRQNLSGTRTFRLDNIFLRTASRDLVADNSTYRYGYQGQERDDEAKGSGNSLNFEYRMHDPRIGRFFTVDPLAAQYAYNSPYAFSENKVVHTIELEGMEARRIHTIKLPGNAYIEFAFPLYRKHKGIRPFWIRFKRLKEQEAPAKTCFKIVNEEEIIKVTTVTTEVIKPTGETFIDDLGSSTATETFKKTYDENNKGHRVSYDTFGDARNERLIIRNKKTGEVIFDSKNALHDYQDAIVIPEKTPFVVEMRIKGGLAQFRLDISETTYTSEKTTKIYENGKLVSTSKVESPTDRIPGEEEPREETHSEKKVTRKRKVDCDCDEEGAQVKK